jgi:hypothetical protein
LWGEAQLFNVVFVQGSQISQPSDYGLGSKRAHFFKIYDHPEFWFHIDMTYLLETLWTGEEMDVQILIFR